MKKFIPLIVALFVVFSSKAVGQTVSIGVRGGASTPNLTTTSDNPLNEGYSSKFGGDVAIFAEFHFSDLFSIQPMLEFSQQGGKRNGRQALPVSQMIEGVANNPNIPEGIDIEDILVNQILEGQNYIYLNTDVNAKLNYLMLPVLAKVGWDLGPKNEKHFRFYADVGPFVGYLVSAHQEFSNTKAGLYKTKDADNPISLNGIPINEFMDQLGIDLAEEVNGSKNIRSELNHWNVGVSGQIGFSYHFSRSSIFIEGGGNYGFINIQKDAENGKNRTGAGTINFGYSYTL